jgi:hypothetical protein
VPARDDVNAPAVPQLQREQVIGVFLLARHLAGVDEALGVDLGREVPGVGQDHAVPQQRQIGGGQQAPGAGDGNNEIGVGHGGIARRRAESVQMRPEPGDGVGVHDGHPGVSAAEVSRDAAPARPVPEDGHLLAVGSAVRQPHEGLERALPDGMLILGELLDRAVVDDQDRQPELAPERFEPHPPRRGFLGPAEEPLVRAGEVPGEEVPAVVQDQIRFRGQHFVEVGAVQLLVLGGSSDDPDALGPQLVDRIGLGGIEVPGRDEPRPSVAQGQDKCHRLGLEMDAGADGHPLERARLSELLRDAPQQPTVLADPVDSCGYHLMVVPPDRSGAALTQ